MKQGVWLALCLCFVAVSAHADPRTDERVPGASLNADEVLARLEKKVSVVRTLQADFIQEKHLAVLDEPLILKGTIFMQKPSLFAWHVREPLRYSVVIQGETARQWDEDTEQVQKMSLSENPALKMAMGQMRDWFSGAYRSMLGEYEVAVVEEDPISLQFIPREGALAEKVIGSVTIIFEGDERYLRQIRVVEKRGDSTLLTFLDTLLNAPIDPSAWKAERASSDEAGAQRGDAGEPRR
jgi:outer membrane lipoprotein-sorting protein